MKIKQFWAKIRSVLRRKQKKERIGMRFPLDRFLKLKTDRETRQRK